MNEKLDYKFGKYDLDFLIKLKAHEFRKQKIDNISEKEIRDYLFNIEKKYSKEIADNLFINNGNLKRVYQCVILLIM